MIDKYTSLVNKFLAPYLISLGYKRRGNYFYFKTTDITYSYQIVMLEKTEKQIEFYILCGIYSIAFNKIIDVSVVDYPQKYDNLFNSLLHKLNETSNYNNTPIILKTDIIKQGKYLQMQIDKAETILNSITNVNELVKKCVHFNRLVHYQDLLKYLACTQNEKLLKQYVKNIKSALHDTADRAFKFYMELLEAYKQNVKQNAKNKLKST
jgi:hypothetical protein